MMRSAATPRARLGAAGAQLMRFAATSAWQVSSASSLRLDGATCEPSVGTVDSEQAASVAAARIKALKRFSILDLVEERGTQRDSDSALKGRSSRRRR